MVVGMHRSGTSSLAGALSRLGVDFGTNLMPANDNDRNEKGFFEDLDVVNLHDRILGEMNSRWDDPRQSMDKRWFESEEAVPFRQKLLSLLNEKFETKSLWGVKDPRLCLVMPLWMSCLEEMGHEPVIIPILRHPMEVTKSLQRRNHFSVEKGLRLWIRYVNELHQMAPTCCQPVVSYEALLEEPVSVLYQLLSTGAITSEKPDREDVAKALGDFISPTLRHETSGEVDCRQPDLVSLAIHLYESLLSGEGEIQASISGPDNELLKDHLDDVHHQISLRNEEVILRDNECHRIRTLLGKCLTDAIMSAHELEKKVSELHSNDGLAEISLSAVLIKRVVKIKRWVFSFSGKHAGNLRNLQASFQSYLFLHSAGKTSYFYKKANTLPPMAPSPTVSVIIPVTGQDPRVIDCLQSIASSENTTLFEVIAVQGGPPGLGDQSLEGIDRLCVMKRPELSSFYDLGNAGAQAAKGQYLLFLRPSVEVRDHFIDELLEVFIRRADAGMVGSKVVNADGALLECGNILWKNGLGEPYGSGLEPSHSEFGYLREVDYVSSTCFLIRASLLRDMGGRVWPEQVEVMADAELACSIREHGLSVYVQPKCVTVFRSEESGPEKRPSCDAGLSSSALDDFCKRWEHALQNQPDSEALTAEKAMRHRCSKAILFLTENVSIVTQDKEPDIFHQCMSLCSSQGFHVTLAHVDDTVTKRERAALESQGVRVIRSSSSIAIKAYIMDAGHEYDVVVMSLELNREDYGCWVQMFCHIADILDLQSDVLKFRDQLVQ